MALKFLNTIRNICLLISVGDYMVRDLVRENLKDKTNRYREVLDMYLEEMSIKLSDILENDVGDIDPYVIKNKLDNGVGAETIMRNRKIWYETQRDVIKIDEFREKLKNNKIRIYEVFDEEKGWQAAGEFFRQKENIYEPNRMQIP